MVTDLRNLKLKTRMMLIFGLIALLPPGLLGLFATQFADRVLQEQMGQRALHVARTIAAMPEIVEAVSTRNSSRLQPISLALAEQIEARFVVIGDQDGLRLAHPNPAMLGRSMSDDDDDSLTPTLQHGRGQVTRALGSLGWSMRARAPIFDSTGQNVIGLVSVGYLLDQVEELIGRYRANLASIIFFAFVISVLAAIWFSDHFKRAIFGLEPEQIGRLFEERNATLESVREGIVAINREGYITILNRAAIKTLNLSQTESLVGRPIQEVIPDSLMPEVLISGEPQFDQEAWIGDQSLIVNRLPVRQGDQITGVVSSFRLKDELDQVSRELNRIQQYADTLRSQSHEYSNKLHTVAGLIQIGATDEAMALIGQETQDQQALIHFLLESVPDPVLAGCLLGKYNRAREMGLNLLLDADSHMAELPDNLPREQLVSIVGNLLDNALEATLVHAGSGGEVRLSMTDLGDDLIFEFEDQGPGVPASAQEQIFEKGFSSKPERGHGLGLHLVRNLLERLGGSVTVEPGDQGGSRFTVYIPKQVSSGSSATITNH